MFVIAPADTDPAPAPATMIRDLNACSESPRINLISVEPPPPEPDSGLPLLLTSQRSMPPLPPPL